MKEKSITPNLILEWENARSKADDLENQITDRIDYILKTWFEAFDTKLNTWYFDGAGEGEVGELASHMHKDNIWGIVVMLDDNLDESDMCIIDKDGDEWFWQSEIPVRWLFDDGFKEEIIQGKAAFEKKERERLEAKKRSKEAKKTKTNALAEAAKKKLTPEELDALKKLL